MTPEELRARVGRDPGRTALLFDFDGTLAPIVDDPAAAAPAPGAVDLLGRLAQRFHTVAVISGRPRTFLLDLLPESVDLSALYGIEGRHDGALSEHPEAAAWGRVIDDVVRTAPFAEPVFVEPKGFSLTVHFRNAPDRAGDVRDWAMKVAADTGLHARPAKASVELHPPLEVDKGTAVRQLTDGCRTVVYVGDDVGDLPAFAAIDDLRAAGVDGIKVATAGPDLPDEVAAGADLVVEDPDAVRDLFAPLA